MIFQGLKARVFDPLQPYGSKWLRELPHVLWGLRMQKSRATGFTPFFLVYGSEAVIPTDLVYGTPRIQHYDEGEAEKTCLLDVDSIEEHRVLVAMQHARYEQQLRRYHDKNVQGRDLNIGDLVLRRIQSPEGSHKLSSPWEGPFVNSQVIRPGMYRLRRDDGADVPNPWNIEHLRRFYP